MRKLLIAVAVVVALALGAVLALPALVPSETVKAEIAAAVEKATGRPLTIGGALEISVLPRVRVEVADVRFANVAGAAEPDMVRLRKLVLDVRLWPLLGGALEVDRFVLVEPEIVLEVDADGRPNWRFAARQGEAAGAGEGGGGPALAGLRLGDVRIENGRIRYRDAGSGASYEVSAANLTLALPAIDAPLTASGSLVYNAETVALDVALATPRRLLDGEPASLRAKIDSSPLSLAYDGTVTMAATVAADGTLDLDVPSVRALAAWAGAPLAVGGQGFQRLRLSGQARVLGQRYTFADADVTFDAITGKGDLALDLAGARPRVEGRLAVGRLDLNPYLPAAETAPPSAGEKAPAGWSETPYDFSGLKAVDADLAFSADEIAVRKLAIGTSRLALTLTGGDLVATVEEMALYGGSGTARLHLDARGAVAKVEKSVALSGVQVQPLLADAAGFDRLTGSGEIAFEVASRGRSEREMVGNLDGNGHVVFRDGAIIGINLGAMVRNIKTAFLKRSDTPAQTDFAELSGTFTIEDGVLTNDDLRLLAPLLRLAGRGTVDLPARRLHYRIEPKVVASAEGQGGAADVAGVMVPVIIDGPWDDLSYRPDLEALIGDAAKNPEKLIKGAAGTVKGVVEGATGGDGAAGDAAGAVKGAIKGLLGGDKDEKKATNPLGAVKGLFGD